MKVGVVGLGHVGIVTACFLAKIGHEVTAYDINNRKIELLNQGIPLIHESGVKSILNSDSVQLKFTNNLEIINSQEIIILTSDYKNKIDGTVDLNQFYSYVDAIKKVARHNLVLLIKARVPLGTTKMISKYLNRDSLIKFDVSYQSELLSEGAALDDIKHQTRLVIGTSSMLSHTKIVQLYEYYYKNNIFIYFTTPEVAEMENHALMNYLTVKLSFFNELAMTCNIAGIDGRDVIRALNTQIESSKNHFCIGFGQREFPSLRAMNSFMQNKTKLMQSLVTAVEINNKIPNFIANLILNKFSNDLSSTIIGVVGLAPNNKNIDLNTLHSYSLIKMLLKNNAKIIACDPVAEESFKEQVGHLKNVKYTSDIRNLLKQVDCIVLLHFNKEFESLKEDELCKLMKNEPIIFDTGDYLDAKKYKNLKYFSLSGPNEEYIYEDYNSSIL